MAPCSSTTVSASPARLKAGAFQHLLLEAEFAFTFRESLPPRAKPYAREEVLAAIDALIPSIEIISPRFKRLTVDQAPQMIADFFGNGGGDTRHTLQGLARTRPCRTRRLPLHRRREAAGAGPARWCSATRSMSWNGSSKR